MKITLEPELEELAKLWSGETRRVIARKFLRWAHELDRSGCIMIYRANRRGRKVTSLPRSRPLKDVLN